MEWIRSAVVLGVLIVNSVMDLRARQISIPSVILLSLAGVIWRAVFGQLEWAEMVCGLFPGIFAWAAAVLSGGGVGYGDVWILLGMGIVLGGQAMLAVSMAALLMSGICALILAVLFHKSRKYEMPFVPFLLAGYLWVLPGGI